MSDKELLRKWTRQELFKGSSRAEIFTKVWRRLGYQWVDMQMIEQWIQFAQGHRKYSPAFEFNKKHCQLLQIVLEEHQKAWTGIAEWHDPQLVTMTLVDSRYALGVRVFRQNVTALVQYDNLNHTQKEMPIDFDIPVVIGSEVVLVYVDEHMLFLIVKFFDENSKHDSFTLYLLSIDVDLFTAALVEKYDYSYTYYYTLFNPKSRRHLAVMSASHEQNWCETGRVDDTGLGLDGAIDVNMNAVGYRIDDKLEYIHFGLDKGFSFREMPVGGGEGNGEIRTLYDIESENGLFDWSMLKAPFVWFGSTCYITKQLKSDLKQCIICRFNENTKVLVRTGIQLVGQCLDLFVEDGNFLVICVKNKNCYAVHKFQLGQVETLFNLSLLAVRRHSVFYTSKEREEIIDHLPERLQTIRLD